MHGLEQWSWELGACVIGDADIGREVLRDRWMLMVTASGVAVPLVRIRGDCECCHGEAFAVGRGAYP